MALEASIGSLSVKLSLYASVEAVASGWGVFLAKDVDNFDFNSRVQASSQSNDAKGTGKKG